MSASDESLQRAEELLERLRTRVDALEASADAGGDVDEDPFGALQVVVEAGELLRADVFGAKAGPDGPRVPQPTTC